MVYGDSLKNCCVAVIVPEDGKMKAWAKENGRFTSILTFFRFWKCHPIRDHQYARFQKGSFG
jgi:hypothetical protein